MMARMTTAELTKTARELRADVLEMVYRSKAGHIGGDLSVMDALTTLYFGVMHIDPANAEDPDRDRFVLSKAHCADALFCVLGRRGFFDEREAIETFSQFGSRYIGHPNRDVPGVEICGGSLGHGLPVAVGMAPAAQKDGRAYRVYTIIGDGEMGEGSNYEAMMAAPQYGLDNLCAAVDVNGLQISGRTDEVMKTSELGEKFRDFGWNVIEVADGNDCEQLAAAYAEAAACAGKPSVLILHTVKGRGVSFMEGQAGWHHGVMTEEQFRQAMADVAAPEGAADAATRADAIIADVKARAEAAAKAAAEAKAAAKAAKQEAAAGESAEAAKPANKITNRQAICETLMAAAETDRDITVLCSDSRGSASMGPFFKAFPEQSVEVGIAEQDLVGIAAGLAACGKKAYVFSPASFVSTRSYEQAKVDVAYSGTNVKLVGISGGISYGALGMTHHSCQDVAAMAALPGMRVYLPSDRFQTAALFGQLLQDEEPAYIRVSRSASTDVYEEGLALDGDRAVVHGEGADVQIIACGEMVSRALEAAELLRAQGVDVGVTDMFCLKPIDREAVLAAARKAKLLVTVEEHSIYGGLGSQVAQITAEECPVRVRQLALPDAHLIAGEAKDVFAHYGLDAAGIAEEVKRVLKA